MVGFNTMCTEIIYFDNLKEMDKYEQARVIAG